MCTLTFFPKNNGSVIITSNRDEAPGRETGFPRVYQQSGIKLLFPKDAIAGGTWLGISDRRRVIGLLNGGFKRHYPKGHYRQSRGLVVVDLLKSEDLEKELGIYGFAGIEPFTLVVYQWSNKPLLLQVVWDGEHLYREKLPLLPTVWSSTFLFGEAAREKRQQWFDTFVSQNPEADAKALLEFHKNTGEGNPASDLVMDRGFVKTRSISQIRITQRPEMYHLDLQNKREDLVGF
jgi:hypothetical protein